MGLAIAGIHENPRIVGLRQVTPKDKIILIIMAILILANLSKRKKG
jgi:hypothetical protein